ncbi:MAG: hypothetical protein E7Z90_05590 [Cyanobacteria bacterium SIG29]|nr:hypothetical protein [Cyanobacteria bacterium SIG29]
MNYNFLKENLNDFIDGTRVNKTALEHSIEGKENSFILKHNIDAISSILNFLNGSDNIFVLNGFMGSGKTYTADFILEFINENVLIFKNSYQEAINSDDILLSLFKDFSIYHNDKKITLPKIESNIFSEKINSYIKHCNSPMLFIFDSFDINTRSKDSQKDILDFINYLSHFEKVKILICSRSFKAQDLISQIGCSEYVLESLSKEEVLDYLEQNEITGSNFEKEILFKSIRGHFLLLELSVFIMQLLRLNLTIFSTEYKKSTKNFLEFLIYKILNTTSDKFVKILLFLATVRHGVSLDFILTQEIATVEDINFLLQKHVLAEKFGKYYLKDYLKNEFIKSINLESKIKVHKFMVELYETELPLKPFERQLFLSRQTMRQEIAYHKEKIKSLREDLIKSGKTKLPETQDFNYFSYSRVSGYDKKEEKRTELQKRYAKAISKRTKNNDEKLKKETNIFLKNIADDELGQELKELSEINNEEISEILDTPELDVPQTLNDYIEIAHEYESAYNYSSAILYYKKALTYTLDDDFEEQEPIIYLKLANCNKKIQETDEATRLYEKVYNIYLEKSPENANSILLEIAQMYTELYKFDKAKEYYKRILYSPNGVDSETIVRVYINLSEIEDNNGDIEASIKFIQKALNEAEKITNIKLLTECYFKYALLLDDVNKTDLAIKYYLRCVQASNNPEENSYMSSAYSNLAEISIANGNTTAGKMYFDLSIEADKKQNNIEGLYYSYLKLSSLYKKEAPEKTYELLLKALSCAKRFDDINYAIAIYIELGDYYLNKADYKASIKSYILAKRLISPHSEEDLSIKTNNKINKIKTLLGESEFNKIIEEIKKKR